MVHVPVQDRRQRELASASTPTFTPRAARPIRSARLRSSSSVSPRPLGTASWRISASPGLALEVRADRGEAGEPALVELAGADERHLAPAEQAEVQHQRRVSAPAPRGAAADAVVEAAHDRVEQPREHRASLDRHERVGEHPGLDRQHLAAGAEQAARAATAVATNIGSLRRGRLRHLAGKRRDLVDAVDLRREQAEALLRIGAKRQLELDAGPHRRDRRRRDQQLDDERPVRSARA